MCMTTATTCGGWHRCSIAFACFRRPFSIDKVLFWDGGPSRQKILLSNLPLLQAYQVCVTLNIHLKSIGAALLLYMTLIMCNTTEAADASHAHRPLD